MCLFTYVVDLTYYYYHYYYYYYHYYFYYMSQLPYSTYCHQPIEKSAKLTTE